MQHAFFDIASRSIYLILNEHIRYVTDEALLALANPQDLSEDPAVVASVLAGGYWFDVAYCEEDRDTLRLWRQLLFRRRAASGRRVEFVCEHDYDGYLVRDRHLITGLCLVYAGVPIGEIPFSSPVYVQPGDVLKNPGTVFWLET